MLACLENNKRTVASGWHRDCDIWFWLKNESVIYSAERQYFGVGQLTMALLLHFGTPKTNANFFFDLLPIACSCEEHSLGF